MTDQTPPSLPPLPSTGQKNLEAFQALLELDEKERSYKHRQGYLTAYILSLILPPIGLYFCVKYIFFADRTPEDIRAGMISLGLTVVSLLFSMWLLGAVLNTPAVQNATNSDAIKQFATPENMKQFKDLMQ